MFVVKRCNMRFRIIPLEERIVLDAAGGLDIAHHSYAFEQASIEHALAQLDHHAAEKAASNIEKALPIRSLTDSDKSAVLNAIKKQISQSSNQNLNSSNNTNNSTDETNAIDTTTATDDAISVRRIEETLPQVKALLNSVKNLMSSGEILNLVSRQFTDYPDGYLKSVIDKLVAEHNSTRDSSDSQNSTSTINSDLSHLNHSSNSLASNSLENIQKQISQVSGLNNTSSNGTTNSGLSITGSLRNLTPLSDSALSRLTDSHKSLVDSDSSSDHTDPLLTHDNTKAVQTDNHHSDLNGDHYSATQDHLGLALETLQSSLSHGETNLDYANSDYSKGEALATYFLNQYFQSTLGINADGSLSYIG